MRAVCFFDAEIRFLFGRQPVLYAQRIIVSALLRHRFRDVAEYARIFQRIIMRRFRKINLLAVVGDLTDNIVRERLFDRHVYLHAFLPLFINVVLMQFFILFLRRGKPLRTESPVEIEHVQLRALAVDLFRRVTVARSRTRTAGKK